MPRSSQRKGRGGELEVAAIARAFGLDAQALGIYEALDVRISIDNADQRFEVKTLKNCLGNYYKARKAGAFGTVQKRDYGEWAVTIPYRELLHLLKLLNSKDSPHDSSENETKYERIVRRVLEVISEEGDIKWTGGDHGTEPQ